ncbi:MAG: hypothetical protein N4A74_05720 [Carboxylicivirga sp.]|jgi:hypothetical protein|nr:hypothetical protein [Carboxylicivirga sp.]
MERHYKARDVEMITASRTVASNLAYNQAELFLARSNWTPEYIADLQVRIENTTEQYLGLDKRKALRDATATIGTIQESAQREASFLKTQIEVDFPETKSKILKDLGYKANFRKVQFGDQEALIQLLFGIKKGMTDELKTAIVEKGTNPVLIEKIVGYASQLNDANAAQESLKETSPDVSKEAVQAFNDIYDEVIGICKIAASFYKDNPVKKKQFTFSKIISAMNAGHKPQKEESSE